MPCRAKQHRHQGSTGHHKQILKFFLNRALQRLEQQAAVFDRQTAESSVIVGRAESERRRISDKYTRQRSQAKEMLEDFKRVRNRQIPTQERRQREQSKSAGGSVNASDGRMLD